VHKLPEPGDKIKVSDAVIEIVDVDGNEIDKVLITKEK